MINPRLLGPSGTAATAMLSIPKSVPMGVCVKSCMIREALVLLPEFQEKVSKGPVAVMTVMPNGMFQMGSKLGQWFVFVVVVGIFTAYVTSHSLLAGAPYLKVFQIAGATAFIGYALALVQLSIWYNRSWTLTLKAAFDGLIYASLTAGAFGWLWPH